MRVGLPPRLAMALAVLAIWVDSFFFSASRRERRSLRLVSP